MAALGGGRLVIVKVDGSSGSSYSLTSGSLSIGSGKDCDIRVLSHNFPHKQCTITVRDARAVIENLSAEKPTILNDEHISTRVLKDGDILTANNGKFRWEYTNKGKKNSSMRKSTGDKPSLLVKHTRNSAGKRKSEINTKREDPRTKRFLETKVKNNSKENNLQGNFPIKTRQVAVVMPQRRNTEMPESIAAISHLAERFRNRTKSETASSIVRSNTKRAANMLQDREVNNMSSLKKRRVEKVEKLDAPVILDKNKRAALMLLTRSPGNRGAIKNNHRLVKSTPRRKALPGTAHKSISTSKMSKVRGSIIKNISQIDVVEETPIKQYQKFFKNKSVSANVISKVSKSKEMSSENKTFSSRVSTRNLNVSKNNSKIPIASRKLSGKKINLTETSSAKAAKLRDSLADSSICKIVPAKLVNRSIVESIPEAASPRKSLRFKTNFSADESETKNASIKSRKSNYSFDMSGVEMISDEPTVTQLNNSIVTSTKDKIDSRRYGSLNETAENINDGSKCVPGSNGKKSRKKNQLNKSNLSDTIGEELDMEKTPMLDRSSISLNTSIGTLDGSTPLSKKQSLNGSSTLKSPKCANNPTPMTSISMGASKGVEKLRGRLINTPRKSSVISKESEKDNSFLVSSNSSTVESFICTLTNALNVMNNSTIDLESVAKTPEYRALSNQIKCIGKLVVDSSMVDSPTPQLLEIGEPKSNRKTRSNRLSTTPLNRSKNVTSQLFQNSPIISPKHRTPEHSDFSESNCTNIINTPNLSVLFEIDASTPVDSRRSVLDKVKQFESKYKFSSSPVINKSTRKSLRSISKTIEQRKSLFEFQNDATTLGLRRRLQGVVKAKDRRSLPSIALKSNALKNSSLDPVSDDSNVTDINAPAPENEIVITPKSTVKPAPDLVREKHSTAKKPVSRKTLIDHLTRSPDIAKELFKSPVKRKLSQSMRNYNSSKTFDDVQDVSLLSSVRDASFDMLTRSSRLSKHSNVSFDLEHRTTPNHTVEMFVSPINNVSQSKNNKSPNINTANDLNYLFRSTKLSDILKVNKKSKSPETNKSVEKSPNISGAGHLNAYKRKRTSKSDTISAKRVKISTKTPKKIKSPKNDLRNVAGVKCLLATPKVYKSPYNDLSDVKGVKKLLKTPRPMKSPENDLRDVRGVKRLLRSPQSMKSPINDLSDVRGVKKLLQTPKPMKSPRNDLRDVRGVKRLLRSPQSMKSPINDLSDFKGVKKLLKTPKPIKSPKNDLRDVRGVKRILKSPQTTKSPINDLSDVKGVKKLLKTPKPMRSPKNDLRDVRGVKRILKSPQSMKSPINDLSDVKGVKKLLKTPKPIKSPKNDLREVQGVRKLLKTPAMLKSPKNNLSDLKGVRRLLRTPAKKTNSPKSNLSDLIGVKEMFTTPDQTRRSIRSNLDNVNDSPSAFTPKSEDLFDSLTGRTPLKTYANTKKGLSNTTDVSMNNDAVNTNNSKHASNIILEGMKNYNKEIDHTNRSRREGTINKTSFSIEVSKVLSVKKEKNQRNVNQNDLSILGQSTPAVKKLTVKDDNQINIRQISPILQVTKEEMMSDTLSPKKRQLRNVINKEISENQASQIKVRSARNTKKPSVKVENVIPRTRGRRKNDDDGIVVAPQEIVEENVIKTRGRRAVKNQKNEESIPEKSVEVKGDKKKVTFASDIQIKNADDKPARATRKPRITSCKIESVPEANNIDNKKGRKPKAASTVVNDEENSTKNTRSRRTAISVTTVIKTTKTPAKKGNSKKDVVETPPKETSKAKKRASSNTTEKKTKKAKVTPDEKTPALPARSTRKAATTKVASPKKSPVRKTRSTTSRVRK